MSKLAKHRRRHAKKNPGEPTRNGPVGSDIVEYIIPGFVAFAATRFVTRVATVQIAKRWPKWAKHAGALGSLGAFAAAWFGAHRVKQIEKWHHPIVVGAGLAAAQSLIQLYVPMLGWMVSDAGSELAAAKVPAAVAGGTSASPPVLADVPMPAGFEETDANTWFSYNDAYDAGGYKGKTKAQSPVPPMTSTAPDDDQIDDLLDQADGGYS